MSRAKPIPRDRSRSATSARRSVGRLAAAGAGAALLVIVTATAAGAHITVHSKDAKPGGKDATLVFKVPNEKENAKTTKIEIDLPKETPLVGVVASPPAGWKAETTPEKIVFSGGSISGDDAVEFPVKVAQLPTADMLMFNAIQTYSTGDVVRWVEMAAAGAPEPAHPMPMLDLKNPSALSADEIADAKEDAEKAAKSGHDDDTAGSKTIRVHAGSGGQAVQAVAGGTPVAPLAAVVVGLGTAGLAARRLVRG